MKNPVMLVGTLLRSNESLAWHFIIYSLWASIIYNHWWVHLSWWSNIRGGYICHTEAKEYTCPLLKQHSAQNYWRVPSLQLLVPYTWSCCMCRCHAIFQQNGDTISSSCYARVNVSRQTVATTGPLHFFLSLEKSLIVFFSLAFNHW